MAAIELSRIRFVLGVAIAMTTAAELFYLIVWGMILFPGGNLPGMLVWTLTCGVAMGAAVAAGVLVFVEGRLKGTSAILGAALVVAVVGSYCAWLCSRIDLKFGYFGGSEYTSLFLVGGIVPAIAGGLLFGWLIYGRPAVRAGYAAGPLENRNG